MSLTPRFAKGPAEMLRALASGDPDQIAQATEFQRESFRAQFGGYPEDCEVIDTQDPDTVT